MLYSRDYKFIFSQVPRTGSSSTSLYLRPFCGPSFVPQGSAIPEIVSNEGVIGKAGALPAFSPTPRYFVHMSLMWAQRGLGKEIWERSRKVANVRNPFSQMVSLRHVKERQGVLPASTDVALITEQIDALSATSLGRDYWQLTHLGTDYVIDEMIIYEDFAKEIGRVSKSLGLPDDNAALQHVQKNTNTFSGQHPSQLISDTARRAIVDDFAWIFDRFGYSRHPDDALEPPKGLSQ